MKKVFSLISLVVLAMAFTGCKDTTNNTGDAKVTVDQKSLTFQAVDNNPQNVLVTVEHTGWEATIDGDWIAVDVMRGNETATVKVSVRSNNTAREDRKGTITFKGNGTAEDKVEVIQRGTDPVAEKVFKVTTTPLQFTSEGGKQTIKVEATNVSWTAEPSDERIAVQPLFGTGNADVQVTLNANTGESFSGEIVFSAEDFEDQKVVVNQEGIVHTAPWLQNRRSAMRLNGLVRTASIYVNPALYPRSYGGTLSELVFAEDGKLTSYRGQGAYAVTYTSAGDPQEVTATIGPGAMADSYKVTFEYGSHGKYIAMEDILTELGSRHNLGNGDLWMPKFIKNLTKITVTHVGGQWSDDEYRYYTAVVSGQTISFNSTNEGVFFEQLGETPGMFTMEYDANAEYPKSSTAKNLIDESDSRTVSAYNRTYQFTANHLLSRTVSTNSVERFERNTEGSWVSTGTTNETVTMEYANNRLNTLSAIESSLTGRTEIGYDDYFNITRVGDKTITYSLDDHHNWTKISGYDDEIWNDTATYTYF